MKNKQVHAIDLTKFIFSILVIVVHTFPFYETFPTIGFISSNIVGRILIPFFFISSGYFFEKGMSGKGEDYFKRYMKRLIQLYLIWSIICIPAGVHFISRHLEIFGLQWILALLAGIFYAGTYYHLWYMAALIFALFICHNWLKKFSLKSLIISGCLLFTLGCVETYNALFTSTYIGNILRIYFSIFYTTRNGLFFGIIYVALGIYIARKDFDLQIKKPLFKSIIFFILLVFEAFTARTLHLAIDYNMYFMAVPFMFYFFCWLLNAKCTFNLNYKSLREYSTIIYFSHGMFLEYIPWLLGSIGSNLYSFGWFRLGSVLTCTLIISYIIKKYITWLK